MKTRIQLLLALAILLTAYGVPALEGSQALTGEYVWSPSERGKLEAVFTPTGDRRWKVAFHFRWSAQPRVFRGTAEGDLGEGDLRGSVTNESERRAFIFRGSFHNGDFRGVHAELRRGRESKTGTLTLKAARRPAHRSGMVELDTSAITGTS